MSAPDDANDLDVLAAEYVIGTLDAAEREAFTGRLATDEAVRRSVFAWERRLSPLLLVGAEVLPPAELWLRIGQALGAPTEGRFTVVDGGRAALDALARSRNRWRGFALSTAAIAATFAAFVVIDRASYFGQPNSAATYVAAVNQGGAKPALIITVDLKTRQVLVRPVAAAAPAGHSLELWYIGTGQSPRAMGLVTNAAAEIPIPAGVAADGAATFAVSVEPPGGSPTGNPTGQVVYSGQLVRQ